MIDHGRKGAFPTHPIVPSCRKSSTVVSRTLHVTSGSVRSTPANPMVGEPPRQRMHGVARGQQCEVFSLGMGTARYKAHLGAGM